MLKRIWLEKGLRGYGLGGGVQRSISSHVPPSSAHPVLTCTGVNPSSFPTSLPNYLKVKGFDTPLYLSALDKKIFVSDGECF